MRPTKPTKLVRECKKKAMREFEIFNSGFERRTGRASPVLKKMKQSEFFYSSYPYKTIKIIDFNEVKQLKSQPIPNQSIPFITNRMRRNEKFLKAPQKIYKSKKINLMSEELKINLFPSSEDQEDTDEEPEIPVEINDRIENNLEKVNKKIK